MSSIGPQLPPHLAKRKRSPEDDEKNPDSPPSKATRRGPSNQDEIALGDKDSDSSEDDGYGPSAPRASTSAIDPTMPPAPAARPSAIGPTLPASAGPARPPAATVAATAAGATEEAAASPQPQPQPPRRRVHGPAPPPASLAERPSPSPSSDSEDDYGPALPGAVSSRKQQQQQQYAAAAAAEPEPEVPRRDDWMLAPPSAAPGYRERDPTKIRSRKFASGATATTRPRDGAGAEVSSIWTETPEEKARRLADAVLGRGGGGGEPSQERQQQQRSSAGGGGRGVEAAPRDDKIRAFTEQTRGRSLYEEHQSARKAGKSSAGGAKKGGEVDEEDDDPSKRAFDREKDMGLGMKISASKRKELLNRASDFGGRFSKGNYL